MKLVNESLAQAKNQQNAGSRIDPIVTSLTPEDTTLFPEVYTSGYVGYASPWIDLCSPNHIVASISRQVLNLEVDYANFCGVRSIIVPGPRQDSVPVGNGQGIAQYARAIQEALLIGTRVNLIVHLPMYREPGLEEKVAQLSISDETQDKAQASKEIDIFTAWDSWHVIRTACDYDAKLFVGKCAVLSLSLSSLLHFARTGVTNPPKSLESTSGPTCEGAANAMVLRANSVPDVQSFHIPGKQGRPSISRPGPPRADSRIHATEARALLSPLRRGTGHPG